MSARSGSEAPQKLDLTSSDPPLVVVVGSGGVGKTTLAAAMGVESARSGLDTLVMTFDPSLRLKDALGVDRSAQQDEVTVPLDQTEEGGVLRASLLDAARTFDRLVERYSPDAEARDRILNNRFYRHMAGHLGGILEYMAVERLYEVASEGRYDRIFLDTPPTSQAIDFLEAPERIVQFLDSGVLKIALRPWFDREGSLRVSSGIAGFLGRRLESFLDRIVGLQLLRDMSEFFRAFEPLFDGFRRRAEKVQALLRDRGTIFVLVTGPGEARIPDTLFFARKLTDCGHRLGPVVVNRVHPEFDPATISSLPTDFREGVDLFRWLGDTHRRSISHLRELLPTDQVVTEVSLEADEPTDLEALAALGNALGHDLVASCRDAASSSQ
ncbi:MAG: ArsA family ATPase [Thermoanaerobaculia bacterium]|nr:ArsA family ATPase [Thermoanaerobaculia bacterium]